MTFHEVRCLLPYAQEQLFDLAADVERYPEFVPWWGAARIWKREGNVYYTDQVIQFAMVRRRFRSKTTLQRPERIDVRSSDGVVRNLKLTWLFEPWQESGCQVSLAVDLELGSGLVQNLFTQAMKRAVGPIMAAFEARAHRLYGPSTRASLAAGKITSRGTGA